MNLPSQNLKSNKENYMGNYSKVIWTLRQTNCKGYGSKRQEDVISSAHGKDLWWQESPVAKRTCQQGHSLCNDVDEIFFPTRNRLLKSVLIKIYGPLNNNEKLICKT